MQSTSAIFKGEYLLLLLVPFIELKMNFFHADKARFLYLLGILLNFLWLAPQLFNKVLSPSPCPPYPPHPENNSNQLYRAVTKGREVWISLGYLWAWPLVTFIGNKRKIGPKEFPGCSNLPSTSWNHGDSPEP